MLQIGEMLIIFGFAALIIGLGVWGIWLVSGGIVESLLVGSGR